MAKSIQVQENITNKTNNTYDSDGIQLEENINNGETGGGDGDTVNDDKGSSESETNHSDEENEESNENEVRKNVSLVSIRKNHDLQEMLLPKTMTIDEIQNFITNPFLLTQKERKKTVK